ncbi:ornithine carbamoyltransferase [Massilibacterium senegalense]|uniref:ornithine carbamoyltransferase n=1 Tax=Massilibacterium senegalense TaxID=1632858 RepID=UPI0007865EE5|nr:ornithine carbamoyltransferase [Massilibacterium senegalense]
MSYVEKAKKIGLTNKDCLAMTDLSKEQIIQLVELAIDLKKIKASGEVIEPLKGKTLGMIFEKSSTRTRVSFEAGMTQLGGHALFLSSNDLQIGRGETIADTAHVLSEFIDAIMIRTFKHETVEEIAEHASIPVINGLTDLSHPCQVLADLQTIYEHKGTFENITLAYVGDGNNNMANSLLVGAAKVGINCTIVTHPKYEPEAFVLETAQAIAAETGAVLKVVNDPVEGVKDADFIYTDVWTSMGFEDEAKVRLEKLMPYQVNTELVSHAKDDYLFLHCLPAHRGEEVTADVIDDEKHSVVFQEAGNRLHAQKALLLALLA